MAFDSLFIGGTGMQAYQNQIDVISNNIANVGTTGFKGQRVNFQDLLYQTQSFSSAPTQTLQQFYGSFITQVGVDTQTANTGVTTQTTLTTNINQTRQSISGINTDEETQNLIKYQSAYQAAAKTISVLNQMLNTVITSLGQ